MSLKAQRNAAFVVPALHFALCLAVQAGIMGPSEGSWYWFPVFAIDFPLSILTLLADNALQAGLGVRLPGLVLFGVTGTLWWYLLSRVGLSVLRRMFLHDQAKS